MPTRPLRLILAAAALLAALIAAPFNAAAAPPLPTNIDPALLKAALQDKTGSLRFIVELRAQADLANIQVTPATSPQTARATRTAAVVDALRQTAASSQAPLLAELAAGVSAGRVGSYQSLWIVNAVAVEADRDTLLAVAARPEVRFVRLDHWRHWVSDAPAADATIGEAGWNIARVRADAVWSALGLDGTGVVVANIDTGVDWLHPALASAYRGYHAGGLAVHTGNWHDATDSGYLYPADAMGHGTHTMGTMVGAGGIGVAPGARWIAVKAFNNQGAGYDSWLHAAFQWVLAPNGDPTLAPDVVNNSWGSDDPSDQTFGPDAAALTAAGIVAVFSAGNNGPSVGSVGSPASLPGVFGVGALDATDLAASAPARRAAPTRTGRAPAWRPPMPPGLPRCCSRRHPG
jgi:subtilisin family serine protease